jgi:hypothetical protein
MDVLVAIVARMSLDELESMVTFEVDPLPVEGFYP